MSYANFSIEQILSDVSAEATTSILYSLVGSLNFRLIGASQRIVKFLDRNEGDVHEEIQNGFASIIYDSKARAETGVLDWFAEAKTFNTLRTLLVTLLQQYTNRSDVGQLGETLKFMTTGPTRAIPTELVEMLVENFGENPDALRDAIRTAEEQQRAELFTIRSRVLDVANTFPLIEDFHDDLGLDEVFTRLDPANQAQFGEKLVEVLNKVRNNILVRSIQRRSAANLGDIPILRAVQQEVEDALKTMPRTSDPLEPGYRAHPIRDRSRVGTNPNSQTQPTAEPFLLAILAQNWEQARSHARQLFNDRRISQSELNALLAQVKLEEATPQKQSSTFNLLHKAKVISEDELKDARQRARRLTRSTKPSTPAPTTDEALVD